MGQSLAVNAVLAERRRQVEAAGYSLAHDDEHDAGELTRAATNYAAQAALCMAAGQTHACPETSPPLQRMFPLSFPWGRGDWKPGRVRRMLVKATALLIAEIERLDRAEAKRSAA